MSHPCVRLFFFSHQCTPVFALDRNAGNIPQVGQLANNLYILLVSVLFAAYCASAPFDSIQCLLSLLQLFFTSLSLSLYFMSRVSILVSILSGLVHYWSSSVHLSGPTSHRISTSPCWFHFSSPISSLRYIYIYICDAAHKHLSLLLEICGMF